MPTAQVTIAPRSGVSGVSAGHTAFGSDDAKLESGVRTARDLLAEMAVAMGGRMAEEIKAGRAGVSSGAEADLRRCWHLSRAFVVSFGMSALGPVRADEERGTGSVVVAEERKLLRGAQACAGALLRANSKLHARVVESLLANETLSRPELERVVGLAPGALFPGSGALDELTKRSCP